MFYDMTWLEKIIFLKQVIGGYSWQSDYETTPYLYRAMPNMSHYYNREIMEEVVGGSVAWNQLVEPLARSTANGITEIFDSESGVITLSGTATGDWVSLKNIDPIPIGHVAICITNIIANPNNLSFKVDVFNGVFAQVSGTGSNLTRIGRISQNSRTSYTVGINGFNSGDVTDGTKLYANIIDLTAMFGSTIADYIYSLERATAGAGVAWLKEHFPKMCQYNPYDAGSIQSVSGLVSHDMVGFNLFDKSTVADGYIDDANGTFVETRGYKATIDYIKVVPSASYYVKTSQTNGLWGAWYDADKNFISGITNYNNAVKTAPNNANYARFTVLTPQSGNLDTFCINLSDASRNGQYEPYRKWSYPLDSTLTLRGIPKLDNGKLYYDGDTYGADGSVNRKYGVVDLGTLTWGYTTSYARGVFYADLNGRKIYTDSTVYPNFVTALYQVDNGGSPSVLADHGNMRIATTTGSAQILITNDAYSDKTAFKTAMDGVYLVYELATPTTETAQPFTKTQLCDSGGTEELVATGVNVWDEEWENKKWVDEYERWLDDPTQIASKNLIPIQPNTAYYFKGSGVSRFVYYDSEGNLLSYAGASSNSIFTTPSNAHYMKFGMAGMYGTTYNHDISINYPSTDTAYHPYGCLVSVGHKSKYAEK